MERLIDLNKPFDSVCICMLLLLLFVIITFIYPKYSVYSFIILLWILFIYNNFNFCWGLKPFKHNNIYNILYIVVGFKPNKERLMNRRLSILLFDRKYASLCTNHSMSHIFSYIHIFIHRFIYSNLINFCWISKQREENGKATK